MSITTRVVHNNVNVDCWGDNYGTSDARPSFEIVLANPSRLDHCLLA